MSKPQSEFEDQVGNWISPVSFILQQRVEADSYGQGQWYAGVIQKVQLDGLYSVRYDPPGPQNFPNGETNIPGEHIRPLFSYGEEIEVNSRAQNTWYAGRIEKTDGIGKYDVFYNPPLPPVGQRESSIPALYIRSRQMPPIAPNERRMYYVPLNHGLDHCSIYKIDSGEITIYYKRVDENMTALANYLINQNILNYDELYSLVNFGYFEPCIYLDENNSEQQILGEINTLQLLKDGHYIEKILPGDVVQTIESIVIDKNKLNEIKNAFKRFF